jgi:hypothetical protein
MQDFVCIVNSRGVITSRTEPNIEILNEMGYIHFATIFLCLIYCFWSQVFGAQESDHRA